MNQIWFQICQMNQNPHQNRTKMELKWSKTLKNYLSCKMCNAIDCEIVHFTTALIVLNAIKEREK